MEQNMNMLDRAARVIIGIILIWAVFYYPMAAVWVWVLAILGLLFIVIGLSGYCMLYSPLKLNFKKK
ncbi:MAG: DUF2892 domain-containing protein [Candidatus Margulisiibacteriota bacterium]